MAVSLLSVTLVIPCCQSLPHPISLFGIKLTRNSPYVAQGAAQAVEDAAALGILLSTIGSRHQIPLALTAYEQSRKQRAETVQQSGTENRIPLHFPDGPEQIARDEQFRTSMRESSKNPDRWSDRETQRFLWGWDAEKAAVGAWKGEFHFRFVLSLFGCVILK